MIKTPGFYATALFIILSLAGCVTAPSQRPSQPIGIPGFYHQVERGQTLWGISRTYGVDIDELLAINRISDSAVIETGQMIFIPKVKKPQYPGPKIPAGDDFNWPAKGKVVATFGQTFENRVNKGLDIQPYGTCNVIATRSGKISFATDNFEGYGKTVIIDHRDGFLSVYAGNSEIFVKPGEYVEKGTTIARVTATINGKNNYLHFEIRKGYIPKNPYFYLAH